MFAGGIVNLQLETGRGVDSSLPVSSPPSEDLLQGHEGRPSTHGDRRRIPQGFRRPASTAVSRPSSSGTWGLTYEGTLQKFGPNGENLPRCTRAFSRCNHDAANVAGADMGVGILGSAISDTGSTNPVSRKRKPTITTPRCKAEAIAQKTSGRIGAQASAHARIGSRHRFRFPLLVMAATALRGSKEEFETTTALKYEGAMAAWGGTASPNYKTFLSQANQVGDRLPAGYCRAAQADVLPPIRYRLISRLKALEVRVLDGSCPRRTRHLARRHLSSHCGQGWSEPLPKWGRRSRAWD